jgi:hypothetical protein
MSGVNINEGEVVCTAAAEDEVNREESPPRDHPSHMKTNTRSRAIAGASKAKLRGCGNIVAYFPNKSVEGSKT